MRDTTYFHINPEKQITDDNKKTTIIKGLEDVSYILDVLTMFAPDPPHSERAVRRFKQKLDKDDPLVVALARKGRKYVESKILPARRNDPKYPNDRWQIDGRPLPLYIRNDGLVCTVTLLLIIDDLSQYPIRARLIPRRLRDEKGFPKRSDFTAADVGILFASAIHYSRTCPGTLYNDHGSQLIALEKFLDDLKEDDFDAIREAKARSDLISLEDLQGKVDQFIEGLRDKPRRKGEKKTRRQLWEQPEGVREAPPIRRLMTLVPEKISRDTAIDYWKFQFQNEEREPRLKGEEDLYRWMVAAARKEFVPLRAANLDQGWEIDICLDREDSYWCEGVLKTEQYLTKDQYPPMLGRVMARAEREHRDKLEPLRAIMEAFGVTRAHKHDISKQPVVLPGPQDAQENPPAAVESHPQGAPVAKSKDENSGETVRPSNVSVRTSPPRQPAEPVGRKFDWNKAPKAQDVLARIESEIQKQKDSA